MVLEEVRIGIMQVKPASYNAIDEEFLERGWPWPGEFSLLGH